MHMINWQHKVWVCSLMLVTVLLLATQFIDGSPTNQAKAEYTACDTDHEIEGFCQRCSSATRSATAYSLCCADVDNVFDWCQRYLRFGIQK
ncbi:uncharacterized protein [Periplaneta americana]|uniref:uncharacterized protein n=1 Tax=Periplaneta americana TaxID=6978 RepID=UPI0037E71DE9